MAHDLGHPPFGHFGEQVLDEKMIDFGGFEGNAQTLRIVTRTEKKESIDGIDIGIDESGRDKRIGLNLTVRSIASILKYDKKIPTTKKARGSKKGLVKGYYASEAGIINTVKSKLSDKKKCRRNLKTIECQIMDIADDIAYSTYDLEDSFKAGFIKLLDLLSDPENIFPRVARKVYKEIKVRIDEKDIHERLKKIFFDIFDPPLQENVIGHKLTRDLYEFLHFYSVETVNNLSKMYAENGYYRTDLTSKLVGLAIRKVFIKKVNAKVPVLSEIELEQERKIDVDVLKHYVYESQILSPKVQIIARRSREIIEKIFDTLSDKNSKGYMLMPNDFKKLYLAQKSESQRKRIICDFIAGMTDRYALEFYGRLTSENPQTIFKPF